MEDNISMEKKIHEINEYVHNTLSHVCDVAMNADADGWASALDYTFEDLMNASMVFLHVAGNIGIKKGRIDNMVAESSGQRFRQLVKDMTGIDPVESAKEEIDLNVN